MKNQKDKLILSYIFLIFSIILLFCEFIFLQVKYRECTVSVSAKIVDYGILSGDENTYYPIYQFDFNGTTYKKSGMDFEDFAFESNAKKQIGKTRKLKINPQNPNSVFIFDSTNFGIITMSSIVIIICVFIIAKDKHTKFKEERNNNS